MSTVFDRVDASSPERTTQSFEVRDTSQVGEVRRAVATLSDRARLNPTHAGDAALIANEGCNNLLRHAGGGHALIRLLEHRESRGVEILFVDKGPGMTDVARCMSDGYSTIGTQGTGLGAIRRAATNFDIYSQPQAGTIVLAQIWSEAPAARFDVGAISVPVRGETICGDSWLVEESGETIGVCVIDGLGHGPLAGEASQRAVEVTRSRATQAPAETLQRMHQALRPTRGAAAAIAVLSRNDIAYGGVGNISGVCWSPEKTQHLISHNGTLGHEARKIQVYSYNAPADAILLMHSDGINTQWRMNDFPALFSRHPAVIAALIYRDFCRGRDDATIVAIRRKQ